MFFCGIVWNVAQIVLQTRGEKCAAIADAEDVDAVVQLQFLERSTRLSQQAQLLGQ